MPTTRTPHTAGPWQYCPGNAKQIYKIESKGAGNDCYEIATLRGPDRRANAELIAAAPTLLSACERVRRAIRWSTSADRMELEEIAKLLDEAIETAGAY